MKSSVKEFSPYGEDLFGEPVTGNRNGVLFKRYTFPPFSVLDARGGEWQARKKAWIDYGVSGGNGRGENLIKYGSGMTLGDKDTSIFDPVLCELMYRWFCPPGGAILDPFAGGSTRGIVAGALGYVYNGFEIRSEQVVANQTQAKVVGIPETQCEWYVADSAQPNPIRDGREYDMVWTCPPYYDLEVYSDLPGDGSNLKDYKDFLAWYAEVFFYATARLKQNRFVAITVGEIRDNAGAMRNFVGDTITTMKRLGLHYYNEAILLTMVGTTGMRTPSMFQTCRKLGKCHQNVLVFYKGDMEMIKKEFPEI